MWSRGSGMTSLIRLVLFGIGRARSLCPGVEEKRIRDQ
jgi:hypothetical protein